MSGVGAAQGEQDARLHFKGLSIPGHVLGRVHKEVPLFAQVLGKRREDKTHGIHPGGNPGVNLKSISL
jgi:hypothetical protein